MTVDAIFKFLETLVWLMMIAVFVSAIISTLISFGVLDSRNRLVYTVEDFLLRVTTPVLTPIRRFMPNFGNVDISPLIAILLLQALQMVLEDINLHLDIAGLAF